MMECSKNGCINPVFAKKLCHSHYAEDRRKNMPLCSHNGCDLHAHAQGLCNKHYRRKLQESKPVCSVTGCERHAQVRGLCNSHYRRSLRHGHINPTRPHDWGAKRAHPLYYAWGEVRKKVGYAEVDGRWRDFWFFVDDVGEKPSPEHRLCRIDDSKPYNKENYVWTALKIGYIEAPTEKDKAKIYQKIMRDKDPERFAEYDRKRSFGLSKKDYKVMLSEQNGVCAICGFSETVRTNTNKLMNLAVDHCHKTGEIRGLLCSKCNMALGGFNDDVSTLKSAIEYLNKHK